MPIGCAAERLRQYMRAYRKKKIMAGVCAMGCGRPIHEAGLCRDHHAGNLKAQAAWRARRKGRASHGG